MTEADKAREPGFYWVRDAKQQWHVAEWATDGVWHDMRWLKAGDDRSLESTDFTAIDERRITREPDDAEMRARLR